MWFYISFKNALHPSYTSLLFYFRSLLFYDSHDTSFAASLCSRSVGKKKSEKLNPPFNCACLNHSWIRTSIWYHFSHGTSFPTSLRSRSLPPTFPPLDYCPPPLPQTHAELFQIKALDAVTPSTLGDVCVYVHIRVYTSRWCVCVCVYIYTYIYMYVYIYVYIYKYIYIYVYIYVYIYKKNCVLIYVYVYIDLYVYIYIQIDICTFI